MTEEVKNRGWMVTFAGTGINLALGVLYAWSVVRAAIEAQVAKGNWDWAETALNDPYAVAVLVFAFVMVPAGRMVDRFGPRWTSTLGGVLVGVGFLVASFSTELWVWILGFGVLAGAGIGMSYAAATPAAVKWFPARRTGLIAGLVVAGFGLASAYIAPLASFLQNTVGISQTMLYLGIAFLVLVVFLSQLLVIPPAGWVPPDAAAAAGAKAAAAEQQDYSWREMMGTGTFWLLWLVYAIGAGAGLMVISFAAGMAKASLGELAWLAVTVLAVGNATGRVFAGILSDKIGRKASLMIFLLFQAALIFGLMFVSQESAAAVVLIATFIGFNYGTNLTLFPSATKDFFGLKSFGLNYGIVFTAWGVGGGVLSRVSKMMVAETGDLQYSCIMAGSLLVLGAVLTLFIRPPKKRQAAQPAAEQPA
jgi:nitrate/nitrite transporter NarK